MSKNSKQFIRRSATTGKMVPTAAAAPVPTTLRELATFVNPSKEIIRGVIGLSELRKLSDLPAPATFAEQVKQAAATLSGKELLLGSGSLKATELAKLATLNREVADLFKVQAPAVPALDASKNLRVSRSPHQPTPHAGVVESRATITSAKDIGLLVRMEREKRKLSQQSFADLAGVGRRFISELENGKASLEFDKVIKVVAAAGIHLIARPR